MLLSLNIFKTKSVLATGILSLLLVAAVTGQEASSPEKARALLDEVKKSDLDRQIALKQTEIDRLKEDQTKTERDSTGLQRTIDSTTALISDSSDNLNKLTADSRRLEHELAVAEARIGAERLKIDGLRALSAAQSKSLSTLARHAEEAEARTQVRAGELELLQVGKNSSGEGEEKQQAELVKSRKTLAAAETRTQAEEKGAHEAMKAAALKMALAESKAANAKRLAENDLTAAPLPDRPKKAEKERSEKRDSDASVRRAQVVKPPAPIAEAPKPGATVVTPTVRPVKPATSNFGH